MAGSNMSTAAALVAGTLAAGPAPDAEADPSTDPAAHTITVDVDRDGVEAAGGGIPSDLVLAIDGAAAAVGDDRTPSDAPDTERISREPAVTGDIELPVQGGRSGEQITIQPGDRSYDFVKAMAENGPIEVRALEPGSDVSDALFVNPGLARPGQPTHHRALELTVTLEPDTEPVTIVIHDYNVDFVLSVREDAIGTAFERHQAAEAARREAAAAAPGGSPEHIRGPADGVAAAAPGSSPRTEPVEPLEISPSNRAFGNEGDLVIDPRQSETARQLHQIIQEADRAGVSLAYELSERDGRGVVTLTHESGQSVEVTLRYEGNNWQNDLLEGYQEMARKLGGVGGAERGAGPDAEPEVDLSTLTRAQLIERYSQLYADAEAAVLEERLTQNLVAQLSRIPDGPRGEAQRAAVVDAWARQAGVFTDQREAQLVGQIDAGLRRMGAVTLHLSRAAEQRTLQADAAEQRYATYVANLENVQTRFDAQIERAVGLTHLRKTANDIILAIEVRDEVERPIQAYRNFDISGAADQALVDARAAQTDAGLDPRQRQLLERSVTTGSFVDPSQFSSREALERYVQLLERRRDRAEDSLDDLADQIEDQNLSSALEGRIASVQDGIDESFEFEGIFDEERRTQLATLDQQQAGLHEQIQTAEDTINVHRVATTIVQRETGQMYNAAAANYGNLVAAINESVIVQAWREIDRGIKDGSREVGRDVGDIIRDGVGDILD